jgi:sodium/bile acid cotransporter 7
LFYLIINFIILRKFLRSKVQLKQAIAVIVMASQKSSPVAISVIVIITTMKQQKGLRTIPCLLGQLGQIFMGTWITRTFSAMVDKEEEEKKRIGMIPIVNEETNDLDASTALQVIDDNNDIEIVESRNVDSEREI